MTNYVIEMLAEPWLNSGDFALKRMKYSVGTFVFVL